MSIWSNILGAMLASFSDSGTTVFKAGTIAGNGYITANGYLQNGDKLSCSASVQVLPGAPSAISISPGKATVNVGQSRQFSAHILDLYNNEILQNQLTNRLKWSVDTNIGSVSSSGLFTASSAGKGTLTASYQKSQSGSAETPSIIGQASINSVLNPSAITCAISPSNPHVEVEARQEFSVSCFLADAEVQCPKMDWTASEGRISPISTTTAIFTAGRKAKEVSVAATESQSSSSEHAAIFCSTRVQVIPGVPASISLSPASASLLIGGSAQFYANVSDRFGNEISNAAGVLWSVQGGIGTVSQNGLFSATSKGIGNVKAEVTTPVKPFPSAIAQVAVSDSPSGGGSGGSSSGGSGGGSFASSSTVSFTCAGKPGSVITRIFKPGASALVEIFYVQTSPSTKVFSSNLAGSQNITFTPEAAGDYSLHVSVGADQQNANFYVSQCTPSTVNVTRNVTIELAPVITPKNQVLPAKASAVAKQETNEAPVQLSVPQQEGAIFGLPLIWVMVLGAILVMVAVYFLFARKKSS